MEPSDFYDALISKVLHFIRSVVINKALNKGEAQQNRDGSGAEGRTRATPLTLHYIKKEQEF
jgi:hypothetical protein